MPLEALNRRMAAPMTTVRRSRARRIWTRVGVSVLLVALLGGSLIAYLFVGFVPPIYGTLVDAVTGNPVAHMTVSLEATAKDWESRKVMRSEQTETGLSGTFFFPPSIYLFGPFQSWQGYSISISDPTVKMEVERAVRSEEQPPSLFSCRDREGTCPAGDPSLQRDSSQDGIPSVHAGAAGSALAQPEGLPGSMESVEQKRGRVLS